MKLHLLSANQISPLRVFKLTHSIIYYLNVMLFIYNLFDTAIKTNYHVSNLELVLIIR